MPARASDRPLRYWVEERLLALRDQDDAVQRAAIVRSWRELGGQQRYVWNKLITGGFRVGVSQKLLVRALAEASGVPDDDHRPPADGQLGPDAGVLSRAARRRIRRHRHQPALSRSTSPIRWKPSRRPSAIVRRVAGRMEVGRHPGAADPARRAAPGSGPAAKSCSPAAFPRSSNGARCCPTAPCSTARSCRGRKGRCSFALLQRRIGRKKLSAKILAEVPVVLLCFDLLEMGGGMSARSRCSGADANWRRLLATVSSGAAFAISPLVDAVELGASWRRERMRARELGTEGLMLKRLDSPYGVGRQAGRLVEVEDCARSRSTPC